MTAPPSSMGEVPCKYKVRNYEYMVQFLIVPFKSSYSFQIKLCVSQTVNSTDQQEQQYESSKQCVVIALPTNFFKTTRAITTSKNATGRTIVNIEINYTTLPLALCFRQKRGMQFNICLDLFGFDMKEYQDVP